MPETGYVHVFVKEEASSPDEVRVKQEPGVDVCVKREPEYGEQVSGINEKDVSGVRVKQESADKLLQPVFATLDVPVKIEVELVTSKPANVDKGSPEPCEPRGAGKSLQCDNCSKQFKIKRYLRQHLQDMPCVSKPCPVCSKPVSGYYRRKHLARHGGQPRLHSCTLCDKTYEQYRGLEIHLNTHSSERPYVCGVQGCGLSFKHPMFLKRHATVHQTESPYACDLCGKRFKRKHYLSRHLLIHEDKKQFQCDHCNKAFVVKKYLADHMRFHTGEKSYKCKECDKRFGCKSGLNRHVRSHLGLKPHKCGQCGAAFTTSVSLREHSRSHAGEEAAVECAECGQRFTRRWKLAEHRRAHARRPHACRTCGELFDTRGKLRGHMKKHKDGQKNAEPT